MSYVDDLSAAVEALGTSSLGAVWGLAMASWESDSDRDGFLSAAKQTME